MTQVLSITFKMNEEHQKKFLEGQGCDTLEEFMTQIKEQVNESVKDGELLSGSVSAWREA